MEFELYLISYPNKIFWIYFTAKSENIVENFPDWLTFNLLVKSNSIFYRPQKPMDVFPQKMLFPLAMGAMICFDAQVPICLRGKTSPCFSPIMEEKVLRSLLKKIKSAKILKKIQRIHVIISPICLRAKAGLCASGQ